MTGSSALLTSGSDVFNEAATTVVCRVSPQGALPVFVVSDFAGNKYTAADKFAWL
jgi:hypothetical protein